MALTLSNLPVAVIREVLDKLEPIDRLVIRKVSRNLRTVSDNTKFLLENVKILISNELSTLKIGECNVEYSKEDKGTMLKCITVEKSNYISKCSQIKFIVNDFSTLMKISKPSLKHFTIRISDDIKNKNRDQCFTRILNTLNSKSCLKVSNIEFGNLKPEELAIVLPSFYAGHLEEIVICHCNLDYDLTGIVSLEQWKQAKYLDATWGWNSLPIEYLFHFVGFKINFKSFSLSDAIKIREVLEKTVNFQSGMFIFEETDIADILEVFNPDYDDGNILPIYLNFNNSVFLINASRFHFEIKKK